MNNIYVILLSELDCCTQWQKRRVPERYWERNRIWRKDLSKDAAKPVEKNRDEGMEVRKEGSRISDLLVTNSDLSRALWTALPSYRLLRLRFTHDGQQRLQQHIQQTLHHHLYLLLHRALLQTGKEKHCLLDQCHQRDVQSFDDVHIDWSVCTNELLLIMEKMLLRIPEQIRSSFCCRRCRWMWWRTTGRRILLDSI